MLRNPLDHEVTKTPGTALALLFNGGKLKADADVRRRSRARRASRRSAEAGRAARQCGRAAPKKEEPFVMEIISGHEEGRAEVRHPGEGK